MKIDWRQRAHRQVGRKEGLLVLWRDTDQGCEELVLRVSGCTNPECACHDVYLDGAWVACPFDEVRATPNGLSLACRKDTPRGRPDLSVSLKVDVGFGAIESVKVEGGKEADVKEWLASHLDDELLDLLHEAHLELKGQRDDETIWREEDWDWWEPTRIVHHEEAFPFCRWDGYVLGERRFYAFLFVCANPGCTCTEATVDFVEVVETGPMRAIGTVRFDVGQPYLPAQPEIDVDSGGQRELVVRLWDAFLARHKDTRWLQARANRVREFGRLHLLPAFRTAHKEVSPSTVAKRRVGRNEPCPCGSGKKYKRCCGS
jgi:hypothetical protein